MIKVLLGLKILAPTLYFPLFTAEVAFLLYISTVYTLKYFGEIHLRVIEQSDILSF